MKALLLVTHGPEMRSIEGLLRSGIYSSLAVIARDSVADEVQETLPPGVRCVRYRCAAGSRRWSRARYLALVMDSIARRVNRMRGIRHYSYAKSVDAIPVATEISRDWCFRVAQAFLDVILRICSPLISSLYRDAEIVAALRRSECSILVCLDHQGGSDPLASNARAAGLSVHYYLNNQKDLSIRPYAPLFGDRFFCWFESQRRVILDAAGSQDKVSVVGVPRIEALRSLCDAGRLNRRSPPIKVLHCLSDPVRRPHEIESLVRLLDQIGGAGLSVRFTLRQNPMSDCSSLRQFDKYPFVSIVSHGWRWDPEKFLNFPDSRAELAYAELLQEHDVVSALPSTTLVEGFYFGKALVCLADDRSPYAAQEVEELELCVPSEIVHSGRTRLVLSVEEYVEFLREIDLTQ